MEAYVAGEYDIAFEAFSPLANEGYTNAQNLLGVMYRDGKGVEQDARQAAKWFSLAAKAGNANAQFNLATMYNKGIGVPKDYCHAYMWFNLAAAHGDTTASVNRDELEKSITSEQIAEAQRMMRRYLQNNEKISRIYHDI